MSEKLYRLDLRTIDKYFQKSHKFLYPLLGIKNNYFQPTETFLQWEGHYSFKDARLICVYELLDKSEFKLFEKTFLFKNRYYETFKNLEGNFGVYIFNLSDYKDDFINIAEGKYSKVQPETQSKILGYYANNKYSREYMYSYLSPNQFYSKYAEILGVDEETLREHVELCDPPNIKNETLDLKEITDEINIEKDDE